MFPLKDTVPGRSPPVMTVTLILINAVVFVIELQLSSPELNRLIHLFGVVPARYTHPAWARIAGFPMDDYWPFVTSMFLHGGWFHIIGNMWFLWLFGDNVEDQMGPIRFLGFYLLCGVVSNVCHTLINPGATVPAIGASGAIAGVMGAYFVLSPLARIITLIPIFIFPFFVDIPAFVFMIFWFWMQLFSGTATLIVSPQAAGGIAWWAHVGGFIAGLVLVRVFLRPRGERRRLHPDEYAWHAAWHGYRY